MLAEAGPFWADLVINFATAVAVSVAGVALLAEVFRRSRRLYNIEATGLSAKLVSAETRSSSETDEELKANIRRAIAALSAEDPGNGAELADEVARRLREDVVAATQAAADRGATVLADEYHAQGLAQAKIAFLVSLVFASLGFLLFAASVVAVLLGADVSVGVVSAVCGSVVEAVASLFFVQSNRARALMVEFFDRLRLDRSLEESLKLAESIPDPLIRSRLQTLLAVRLAQAEAADDVLEAVMASRNGGGPSAGAASTVEPSAAQPPN